MTDGPTLYLIISFISICFVIKVSTSLQLLQQCSSFCVCDTWYGLQRASCTSRHLYSIHTSAPNNVQALDLSNNVISFLNNFELMDADLTKLQYLNLSKNAISEIGLNAFDGLPDLTVLDLSENRLYYVLNEVFRGTKKLRILKLSKNNFNSHVPKLQSSSITELRLDSCEISHLPPDTFNGLTHVRRLDLSNNLMIQISNTVVQTLQFLNKLSLEGNPWSCNKIIEDLQLYLEHKNIEFIEVCGKKVKQQKFEKMIIRPVTKPRNYHRSAITSTSTQETKSISKNNISSTSSNENLVTCEQAARETITINSVYWILCIGFLSGISSGLIISYIWLAGKCSCHPRCGRREHLHDVSQRLSLLNSYLHGRIGSDRSLAESCSTTPPPPYQEVMLRPNLYRFPSIVSNLNNNVTSNDTGYRERYT